MNGTRDRYATFGNAETKDDMPAAPRATGRRPRMTVAARESPPRQNQKKQQLSSFYRSLTSIPYFHEWQALDADEIAEQAEAIESKSKLDDNGDNDYEDAAKKMTNDEAKALEATTPPATPRSKPSPKQK
ncbi:hypothetical protein V7S43_016082 [Phytophthora oleae]|uniref:Uncharacterized protein n=1 Tax=Phytophthora oleae TaxID=2107226 RepID=A0ABD3F0H8_9STRA